LLAQSDGEAHIVQASNNIFLGPQTLRHVDTSLYMNFERPLLFNDPLLGLCGCIKGEAIGNVGVPFIHNSLLQSLGTKDDESTSPSSNLVPNMLNIPASIWALAKNAKPTGDPDVHTYIPVQSNSAWVLFIAGEHKCRIAFGCALCAAESSPVPTLWNSGEMTIEIGYK